MSRAFSSPGPRRSGREAPVHPVLATLVHPDSLLSEVAPNKDMSLQPSVGAVCGSPGKRQGPRALSCVVGVREAPTLALFPEASMNIGFCITHSSQTKAGLGRRGLSQHLCARHLLDPFGPHTQQQVLLSCLQVKLIVSDQNGRTEGRIKRLKWNLQGSG